jgi:hypothetical protein
MEKCLESTMIKVSRKCIKAQRDKSGSQIVGAVRMPLSRKPKTPLRHPLMK